MAQNNPNNLNDATRITNELESSIVPSSDVECVCSNCGETFTISVKEQEWYQSLGYSLPKRCFTCRKIRRAEQNAFNRGRRNVLNTISAISETLK